MQTEEILQHYANRKLIRRFTLIGFFAAEVLWLSLARQWLDSDWLRAGGGLLLVAITFFIDWRYFRCPACDRALWRDQGAHCPHCGTRLVA